MRLFGRFSKIVGLAVAMAAFLCAATIEAKDNQAITRAVRGSATYSNDKGASWKKLSVGQKLSGNSIIRTAPASVVDLFLGDNGPVVRVTEDTTMGIDKLSSEGAGVEKVIETELNLKNGRILGNVKKLAKASRYEVTTPVGVAGIRGTEYDISANGDVTVISGTVVVVYILNGQPTTPVTVTAGQTVQAPTGANPVPIVITAPPGQIQQIQQALAVLIQNALPPPTVIQTPGNNQPQTDPVRENELSDGAQ